MLKPTTYVVHNLLGDFIAQNKGVILTYEQGGKDIHIVSDGEQIFRNGTDLITHMPLVPPGCVFYGPMNYFFNIKSYLLPLDGIRAIHSDGVINETVSLDKIYFTTHSDVVANVFIQSPVSQGVMSVRYDVVAKKKKISLTCGEDGSFILPKCIPGSYTIRVTSICGTSLIMDSGAWLVEKHNTYLTLLTHIHSQVSAITFKLNLNGLPIHPSQYNLYVIAEAY